MTTAKSSFSIKRFLPVYKNLLRRNRGTALFYGALGFLFFALQYFLVLLEYMKHPENSLDRLNLVGPASVYNGFAVVFFTAMSIVIPIVVATNLFGYMQNKRSVDVYHSLPLTRNELYLATSAAGMTLIWIPLIINFLFVVGFSFFMPYQRLSMIFFELLCWMIITFVIFAITAFAAVQVGTTFDTSIFSMALNASIAAVYLVVIGIASGFLYGFYDAESNMQIAYRLSPVSLIIGRQMIGIDSTKLFHDNNVAMALWLVAGIVIFILGMMAYKKRSSEQAESVGTFGPLQMFVRSVGTLVGGTMIGAIFCSVFGFEESKPVFLITVAIGSLVVYFIGDVILTRTVRSIPKALPSAALTTLAVCLLVGGLVYGGFGYETRVPTYDSIKSVSLKDYRTRYSDEPTFGREYSREYIFSDPEAVKLILAAHEAQVESHVSGEEKLDNNEYNYSGMLNLNYTFKDGKTMSRGYYEIYPKALDALLALECHPEMIRQTHAAFKATADMLSSVSVTNALGYSTKELTLDDTQKQQLLEAVRSDMLAQPVEELTKGTQALGYLRMEYKYADNRENAEVNVENRMGVMVSMETEYAESSNSKEQQYSVVTSEVLITESFKNTRALLKQLGAEEQLQNDFSKVKKAYVGIIGYHFFGNGTAVQQTALEQLGDLNDSVLNSYYDGDKDGFIYDGDLSNSYVELDPSQLTAMRKDLTSVYTSFSNNPYVVVCVIGEQHGQDVVSGYYFMPFKALSEEMKYQVCESARNEYGDESLINMGYDYSK